MNRTTTLALVCSVLGILAGCSWQGRTNQSPAVSPAAQNTQQQQPARLASLAEQKMCDEQARKKFHEDNPHPTDFITYVSHYDPKANICYIRVDSTTILKNTPASSTIIYDAFEGREYGSYVWVNPQGKQYWEVKPMRCYVKPIGKDEISCSSEEEFNQMAEAHFGIAR